MVKIKNVYIKKLTRVDGEKFHDTAVKSRGFVKIFIMDTRLSKEECIGVKSIPQKVKAP